ncbi:MAG: hypothetical protein V4474_01190 [Patescibacteria group bacterium]
MQDFRKRRNIRSEVLRATISTAGVVGVGVLAYFAVHGAWGMYQKFAAASAASAAAEQNLAELQARHAEVETEATELGTPRGVEGALRERYGVARPGEGQITVVHQAASSTSGDASDQGWWGKLWHALFVW